MKTLFFRALLPLIYCWEEKKEEIISDLWDIFFRLWNFFVIGGVLFWLGWANNQGEDWLTFNQNHPVFFWIWLFFTIALAIFYWRKRKR